ncbi:putative N-acetylmannosaminyltransferase [Rubripirellula amarantea]|uniref:Putative N-acetylmannosaminyltransferase n=1 Tax=Rubripirellula amarantea TaxID=2527999 RepID=A0A5C5WQS9_9BACT|nr:WecB/TagA/CpsF family glycosyltransferase [Rubripirellula amarantea]TWT52509.1 putative N-acetylmannosaminyltransferase [Rubripirellula amarantea]
MLDLGKRNVLGIGVNAIDYEAAVAKVIEAGRSRSPMAVTALAVHGVMTGVSDKAHKYRLNQFDLVCPDGQPVRWALNRLHGCDLNDRVYGPELTLRLCEAAAKEDDVPVYLFGATEEMLDQFAERLCEKFPGLKIAGRKASRFRTLNEQERDELAAEINASGAGMCFVGLGCPRQEVFAYEMRDRVRMPLIAVGAAFAFHAGMLEQAPAWMQRNGLEWFFRLTREPGRLWKRYSTTNPAFASLAILQKLKLYAARTDSGVPPTEEVRFG